MYSEEEETQIIVKIVKNDLDFNLDAKNRPANLYLEL